MHTSEAPAGLWAFMSSNAVESAWSRGSDESFNVASTSGPHPGAALLSRHKVTGAVQLPSADPSASQVSPPVNRAAGPCPTQSMHAASGRVKSGTKVEVSRASTLPSALVSRSVHLSPGPLALVLLLPV